MDENIERRNHYLDLAGIENYTSQFGPGKVGRGDGMARRAGGGGPIPPGLGEGVTLICPVKDVAGDDVKSIFKN